MVPSGAAPQTFAIISDGDSRERHWIEKMGDAGTAYEQFWQHHVVPITYRPYQKANGFVRPEVPLILLDLADGAYAVFFHLTGMLFWKERILGIGDVAPQSGANHRGDAWELRNTDAMYYLCSHAYSLMEAIRSLCDAVDRAIEEYSGGRVRFGFTELSPGHWAPRTGKRSKLSQCWNDLYGQAVVYRNFLVHARPVFIQSARMPIPDREAIDRSSGLQAISRLALATKLTGRRTSGMEGTIQIGDQLARIEKSALALCDVVFTMAHGALQEMPGESLEEYQCDQLECSSEELSITLSEILAERH